jgi:glutamine amidotransferase
MEHYDALLIDAGTGNLHSVQNALKLLGRNVRVTTNPSDLAHPARLILPGVGAFSSFMDGLAQRGLVEALQRAVKRGDPLLGICVGMQALFEASEEMGLHPGLGLLRGRVVRFPEFENLKVPHTGWNQIEPKPGAALFSQMPPGSYAYFNHSYYCAPADSEDVCAVTGYGLNFCSAVQRENLFGVQFHPEKSQRVGQRLLLNFFTV